MRSGKPRCPKHRLDRLGVDVLPQSLHEIRSEAERSAFQGAADARVEFVPEQGLAARILGSSSRR